MALRKTRLELRTACRNRLDEVSPSFWTNADLNDFLNGAKDRVIQEVRKTRQDYFEVTRTSLDGTQTILGEAYDCANFRLVPGVRDYTLPPDFQELVDTRCLMTDADAMRLMYRRHTDYDFRRALEEPTAMRPAYYTLLGERTWRVAPRPDAPYDFELTYVYVVPDMASDAETLDMPHPLHMAVREYAVAEALMKDHSPDAAAWEAKGNATIALFLGANERQDTDTPMVRGYLEDWA